MNANLVYHEDARLQDLGGGVTRRVLAYTPLLMIVEVSFEQGSTGAVHSHPHSQNTYILSGRFRFNVDGEDVEVAAGDTLAFPADIPHGTLCLEAGTLLDIFTPMREDFVN
ncbi:MAG: cupin domain-containing protein [Synergistaceae bacterium]|nr:cupin domain-containing protein [Synergistaceae bacterium]